VGTNWALHLVVSPVVRREGGSISQRCIVARVDAVTPRPVLEVAQDDACCAHEATATQTDLSGQRRNVLNRRVRLLVAATISYNVVEGVVAIAAGTIAGSTALIGFGLDSVIEVASAAIVAWQFSARDPETRERIALRVIAYAFFALATYVTVESTRALFGSGEADTSRLGIVLASMSLLIMPFLSYAQRKAGRELGSLSAVADSKQTLLCTYLSAVLLVGLLVNSLFGWSWADPLAGFVIAAAALKEGRDAWKGDACCAPLLVDRS